MAQDDARTGFGLGVVAYLIWGVFPLYFPLLEPAGPIEILAHRVVWSLLTMTVLVLAMHRGRQVRAVVSDRRTLTLLAVAAVMITTNWGTYIYGVTHDHVVETALGYFITPLVTMLMGVVILRERLRSLQWVALAVAGVAVVVLTIDYGSPPWIALILALSFGTYGLAKKSANVGAVESLTIETAIIGPFALGYLVWLTASGASTYASNGIDHTLLLSSAGLVTAVPLICFGAAATRVSMVTLGLLQYLAPIIQFGLGVLWFGEHMPTGRWIGFGLVWVALMTFTYEAIRYRGRQLALVAEASAV